jgi:hypothetical protein
MSEKLDFKKYLKSFYVPENSNFELVELPPLRYIALDGSGSPQSDEFSLAIQALYATAYPLKFISKAATGKDYVIPPLEALWWADDYLAFTQNERDLWKWRLLSGIPEWVTEEHFNTALAKATAKGNERATSIEMRVITEGLSYQALYAGPFSGEGDVLSTLHDVVMPENGYTFNGLHHEIYLSDMRRTAPDKLKTILRQPVKLL